LAVKWSVERTAALLVMLAWSALAMPAAVAGEPGPSEPETHFYDRMNEERRSHGVSSVLLANDLAAVARRHAAEMALSRQLRHNDRLPEEVGDWARLGENVGTGDSVSQLHAAFMASPQHRRHIVDPAFAEVGIGVARSGDMLWVTQVFRQPGERSGRLALPSPAPAPPASGTGARTGASATGSRPPLTTQSWTALPTSAPSSTAEESPTFLDPASGALLISNLSADAVAHGFALVPSRTPGPGIAATEWAKVAVAALLLATILAVGRRAHSKRQSPLRNRGRRSGPSLALPLRMYR
jgi:hypothetical protein